MRGRCLSLISALCFLGFALDAFANEKCENLWTVRDQVDVTNKRVTFFDLIAWPERLPLELKQKLRRVLVVRAPSVSASVTVRGDQLRRLLKSHGLRCFSFPAEVVVRRSSIFVSKDEIRAVVVQYLQDSLSQYGLQASGVDFKIQSTLDDLRIRKVANYTVDVVRVQPSLPAENVMLWVELLDGKELLRTLKIRVQVINKQEVWVSQKNLRSGEPLLRNVLGKRIVNNASNEFILSDESVEHLVLRTAARVGEPLARKNLQGAGLIRKGSWHMAYLNLRAVSIEVRVKALESADFGETFKALRNSGEGVDVKVDGKGKLWIIGSSGVQ